MPEQDDQGLTDSNGFHEPAADADAASAVDGTKPKTIKQAEALKMTIRNLIDQHIAMGSVLQTLANLLSPLVAGQQKLEPDFAVQVDDPQTPSNKIDVVSHMPPSLTHKG